MKSWSPSFRRGIRDTLPLVVPIGIFAALFGALAVQAGLTPWLTMLCSLIVLSGAAQVALVGLLSSGTAPVVLAVTGLALRHLPMSAALSGLVGSAPGHHRIRLAWVLVDETFALTMNAARDPAVDVVSFKTGADLVVYTTWVAFTAVGAFLGADFDASRLGLGVFFPLVFLGLAAPFVRGRRQWATAAASAAASITAVLVLPGEWRVTAAAILAALVGSRIK